MVGFIGMTLVNKITQVSGAQFHNTSSAHCTVCSPPHVSICHHLSPHTLLYLHLLPLPSNHYAGIHVHQFLLLFFSFCSTPPLSPDFHHTQSCHPTLSESISILLCSPLCLLGSTSSCNHIVFILLCLAYFN